MPKNISAATNDIGGKLKSAASRSVSRIVISGNMDFSRMGVTLASHTWTV